MQVSASHTKHGVVPSAACGEKPTSRTDSAGQASIQAPGMMRSVPAMRRNGLLDRLLSKRELHPNDSTSRPNGRRPVHPWLADPVATVVGMVADG